MFVVRASPDAKDLPGELRAALTSPEIAADVRTIDSMSELVSSSIGGRGSNRLMMLVASLFGAIALALTTIGIFGVMLHTVTERLPEMGVRMALGATRGDVMRLVAGHAARVVAGGVALGLVLTWAATRGLGSLLFELKPTDARTYAFGAAVLAAAACAACLVPVRRAAGVDPAELLRRQG
jgi:ABC-type antimicrobial peptide transport system permease subunit